MTLSAAPSEGTTTAKREDFGGKVKLILASQSPRRTWLLNQWGVPHEVLTAPAGIGFEEKMRSGEDLASYVVRNSIQKPQHLIGLYPEKTEGTWCLGADTIVVCPKGNLLEKPNSPSHALQMLQSLSGVWHEVLTAFALVDADRGGHVLHQQLVVSRVKFRVLLPSEMEAYVASGDPLDKAGAYGIQGVASGFVEVIEGSHSGVMGLPGGQVLSALHQLGF